MPSAAQPRMHIVVGGHVDHGKSTVIGRLLADTGSLPDGKLERVRALCERTSKPFEYAFLLDALKDEQAQGITIDAARVFFRTPAREYVIIDAPGHIEFLRNLVTGAARAEAALLVIDAKEGVQENSRRHGYLMAMLGIRHLIVLVNKMDLVEYREGVFQALVDEYSAFLEQLGVHPAAFLPVAAREGENIVRPSPRMPWFTGDTVLGALDRFPQEPPPTDQPFRMPVQDVYKFTRHGDDRRIVAGSVESGTLAVGDDVVFYPSGKRSRVKSIEGFNAPESVRIAAGAATGMTLTDQIYVVRGEVVSRADEPAPAVTTRYRVRLFWLGKDPLVTGKDYTLKLGTARVPMRVEAVHRVLDASNLATATRESVQRHEVAECTLTLNRPIAADPPHVVAGMGRFVVVDHYEIQGGGIVQEALPDAQSWVRDKVMLRNLKWEPSGVPPEDRATRYGQRPTILVITGDPSTDRKGLAKALEARLFAEGRAVYFLGMGVVLYGVDADIAQEREKREEQLRRLAEVAHLFLDAGMILVISAAALTQEDMALMRTAVDPDRLETIWLGDTISTDLQPDLQVPASLGSAEAVAVIRERLSDRGILLRPW